MTEKPKRFRIPDYDVHVRPAEAAVTQTRQFQRLFSMKQLGLAYLVYPAATHTRGAHSIDCLHQAEKLIRAIKHCGCVSDADHAAVRMAALLHDIGHVPFSHTLEDENVVLDKHDRPERLEACIKLLKGDLEHEHHALVDRALEILMRVHSKDGKDHDWRSDLVGNTICADLLAYITADATWTGIEKRPGYYRIYDYFTVHGGRLCIKLTDGGLRPDVVSAILDLLDMRYALTERVLFHHAKAIASAMLARAARLAGLTEDSREGRPLRAGDEGLLDLLEELAKAKIKKKSADVEAREQGTGALRLLESLAKRRLYKRIYKVGHRQEDAWNAYRKPEAFSDKWRDGSRIEETLREVEGAYDLPRGSLVLWCPSAGAGIKLAAVNVVWESPDGLVGPHELRSNEVQQQFPTVAERTKTMETQYNDLWTLWVGIHRDCLARSADVFRNLERRLQVSCDPVFQADLVREVPGFATSLETVDSLNRLLLDEYGTEAARRVAASPADTGRDATVSETALRVAIQGAVAEGAPKARQQQLPGITDSADSESEENK